MTKPLPILAFLALCVACGSKFEPGGTGGDGGDSAAGGTDRGGSGSAGAPGGGAASGGAPSGGADTAGAPSGGANTAGAPGGGAGGASAGAGGGATAGAGGAADCATLVGEYTALLQKARVCDPAAMDECSASSTLQPIGCGCPTPVNAKSESTTAAKAKYAQIEKNKCNNGPICGIACLPFKSVACSEQTQGSSKAYVCTATQGGVAN